jgi:YHYH protein
VRAVRPVLAVVLLAAFAGAALAAVDPSALPLGDGKYKTSPAVGYVDSCQTYFNGSGAQVNGPWIARSTWSSTEKIHVQGTVHWRSTFKEKVAGSRRVLTGNGLPISPTGTFPIGSSDPAYAYDRNPNSIEPYTLSVSLPASPKLASSPTCVGGTVGVSMLGVPLYSSFDAAGRDALAHELQDACGGHPQVSGQYHFHGLSPCWKDSAPSRKTHLIGWALDGFGIYVEYDSQGQMLSTSTLDACHGRTSVVSWDGKMVRMYHYDATLDFPYLVGCYMGTPITSATGLGIGGPQNGAPPGGP